IKAPIYVVELAAQRMRGWEPEGEPFQRMLNHGIEIPPEASRVNGYTREILERDGEAPHAVYAAFADYAGDRPLVAYNLSYDLDSVLLPEWARLGLDAISRPGFCALRLAQRLLDPVPAGNHKLQTLRQFYRLPARGAHTALGDVETVVDLLQNVLRPLAEARGLNTREALTTFTQAPWYPSRIAFGKHKGRAFREALTDPDLQAWLQWLASSSNSRSAQMGRWYLEQLAALDEEPEHEPPIIAISSGQGTGPALAHYRNPERERLQQVIAAARERLADLTAEYTQEHQAVEVVRASLFERLRTHYERRDHLRLKIEYRRRYLDTLLTEGEEEAETVRPEYEQARDETEREYEEAAAEAAENKDLSDEERQELKTLWRKLVRLYHPDRFAHDPEQQDTYERLMQSVNQARDQGDIERMREIANDPTGFLQRQGWGSLDFSDEAELAKLRQLYDSLQARILSLLEELSDLRESHDYELYRLSTERPDFLDEIALQMSDEIEAEIADLETEAKALAEEIEQLTGAPDPFDRATDRA
ncbi:MAG: exonuclease domain-containing protein, partial [Lamprobacter sp.]|uniref:exonuclease domain-containing protein n=1 Tax=Lamprobacter sp. TaxID=3100796 RepID=UPI002B25B030